MAIRLTAEEERQLRENEYVIIPLRGADGADRQTYHDPSTGQEFPNQPTDPRAMEGYIKGRGWQFGPAPAALKAKWDAGEEQRTNEAQEMEEAYRKANPPTPKPLDGYQEVGADFDSAVASAVLQVLKQLGITPPKAASAFDSDSEPMSGNILSFPAQDSWADEPVDD